jgi:hypothetical protein
VNNVDGVSVNSAARREHDRILTNAHRVVTERLSKSECEYETKLFLEKFFLEKSSERDDLNSHELEVQNILARNEAERNRIQRNADLRLEETQAKIAQIRANIARRQADRDRLKEEISSASQHDNHQYRNLPLNLNIRSDLNYWICP